MNIESIMYLAPLVRQALAMTRGSTSETYGIPQALKNGYDPGIMNDIFKEGLQNTAPLHEYEYWEKQLPESPYLGKSAEGARMSDALTRLGFHYDNHSATNPAEYAYFPSDRLDYPLADPIAGIELNPESFPKDSSVLDKLYKIYSSKRGSPAVASAMAMLQNNPNIGI